MSMEDLAFLIRLLKKAIESDQSTHQYVKDSYHYFLEVYNDSEPDGSKLKEF